MGERQQFGFSEVPLGFGVEHLQPSQEITLVLFIFGSSSWHDTQERISGVVASTQLEQKTFTFFPDKTPDVDFANRCPTSITLEPFTYGDANEHLLCFVAAPTPPTSRLDTTADQSAWFRANSS